MMTSVITYALLTLSKMPVASPYAYSSARSADGGIFAVIFLCLYFGFILGMLAFGLFMMVFWILMLIDAVKRDYANPNDKTMWILIIALTQGIGAIIYYFMVKRSSAKIS